MKIVEIVNQKRQIGTVVEQWPLVRHLYNISYAVPVVMKVMKKKKLKNAKLS